MVLTAVAANTGPAPGVWQVDALRGNGANLNGARGEAAPVSWRVGAMVAGQDVVSPDLSSVVAAVIDDDPRTCEDVVLVLNGTGQPRTLQSFEGNPGNAAHLTISPGTPSEPVELFEVHRGSSCLLYTSPSPRDATLSRMPSSA